MANRSRICSTYFTGSVEFSVLNVVHKGDVVGGMPVQAVGEHVKGDCVNQVVDGTHDLKTNAEEEVFFRQMRTVAVDMDCATRHGFRNCYTLAVVFYDFMHVSCV